MFFVDTCIFIFIFEFFFFGIFFFNVECRCGFFPVNSVLRRIGSLVIRCFAAARSQKQCRERHLESLYITLMVYHDWTIAFIWMIFFFSPPFDSFTRNKRYIPSRCKGMTKRFFVLHFILASGHFKLSLPFVLMIIYCFNPGNFLYYIKVQEIKGEMCSGKREA